MRVLKKTKSIAVLLHGAVVIPVLGFVSAVPLRAQVTSGSIVGVVYDQSGAAIPNSTVTANSNCRQPERHAKSRPTAPVTMRSCRFLRILTKCQHPRQDLL